MSNTPRRLPDEAVEHPAVTSLLDSGRASGFVVAHDVRAAAESVGLAGRDLRLLLELLADQGVRVEVNAQAQRAVAASKTRSGVSADAGAAKKTATKKAS